MSPLVVARARLTLWGLTCGPLLGALALWLLVRGLLEVPLADPELRAAVSASEAHVRLSELSRGLTVRAVWAGVWIGLLAEIPFLAAMALRNKLEAPSFPLRLGSVVFTGAAVVTLGIARSPSAVAPWLYNRGGLRRTVQILCADGLGSGGASAWVLAAWLGACVALWARTEKGRHLGNRLRARARRLLAPVSMIALAMVLPAFVKKSEKAPTAKPTLAPPGPRAVLWVIADGLRFEHVSPAVTPSLWALSSRARYFEEAYASTSDRQRAFAAMLGGTSRPKAASVSACARLARKGFVVRAFGNEPAQMLEERGCTGMFPPPDPASHALREALGPAAGFLRGLGVGAFPARPPLWVRAEQAVDGALRALSEAEGKSTFVVLLLGDAQRPFRRPDPGGSRSAGDGYRGYLKYDARRLHEVPRPLSVEDVDRLETLGLRGASQLDRQMGRLFAGLTARGLSPVFLVTGVAPAEPGKGAIDAPSRINRATHFPMWLGGPAAGAARSTEVVRDVDVLPTLLRAAGVAPEGPLEGAARVEETPPGSGEGVAFGSHGASSASPSPGAAFHWARDRGHLLQVRDEGAPAVRLYRRVQGRFEGQDEAAAHPEDVTRLLGALRSHRLDAGDLHRVGEALVPRIPFQVPQGGTRK